MNRHSFTTRPLCAGFALAILASPALMAQTSHDHAMAMPMHANTASKTAPAEGEVQSVDRAKGTIVLKHGPLYALNMPPMTMEFSARNPALLANVKRGDRVRFTPEQGKDGSLVIATLEVLGK